MRESKNYGKSNFGSSATNDMFEQSGPSQIFFVF